MARFSKILSGKQVVDVGKTKITAAWPDVAKDLFFSEGVNIAAVILSTTLAFSAPVVSSGATISAGVLNTTISEPSAVTSGGTTSLPTTLNIVSSESAPSVSSGSVISPTVFSVSISLVAPSISSGATVSVSVLSTVLSEPATTISGGATLLPVTLNIITNENSPSLSSGATALPDGIDILNDLGTPLISAGVTIQVSLLNIDIVINSPVISSGITTSPSTPSIIVSINSPNVVGSEGIQALLTSFSLPSQSAFGNTPFKDLNKHSGSPRLEFELWNDTEGSLIIDEPIGWDEVTPTLQRDGGYYSVIEVMDVPLTFYNKGGVIDGGMVYLKNVQDTQGPDATVLLIITIDPNGEDEWEPFFIGKVDFSEYKEQSEGKNYKWTAPILRSDGWSQFLEQQDTDVDIQSTVDKYGNAVTPATPVTVEMKTQVIPKRTTYKNTILTSSLGFSLGAVNSQLDYSGTEDIWNLYSNATAQNESKEIRESYEIPLELTNAAGDVVNILKILDEKGDITVNYNSQFRIVVSGGVYITSAESDFDRVSGIDVTALIYLQKNAGTPILVDSGVIGGAGVNPPSFVSNPSNRNFVNNYDFNLSGSETVTVAVNDEVRLYMKLEVVFTVATSHTDDNIYWGNRTVSIQNFYNDTEFLFQSEYQNTNAEGFNVHDVGGAVIDRIIGSTDKFRSEVLGNENTLYHAYPAAGCFSEYVVVKGLHARGYTLAAKSFFTSWNKWYKGVDPIFCLGAGMVAGKLVVAPRSFFFDSSSNSVNFDLVNGIDTEYFTEAFYKQVKIGYRKWESEEIGGIDDAQTRKIYGLRFATFGKEIEIYSEMIAASLGIEIARRTRKEQSADYKYDNFDFILSVKSVAGSPMTYEPKVGTDFSAITNLQNADTRYNIDLTPARNMLRFLDFLSGCLAQYPGEKFKFSSGEGNYDMQATAPDVDCPGDNDGNPLAEDQDIDASTTPIYIPKVRKFTHPLSWYEYKAMRDNPTKSIGVRSRVGDDFVPHFIMTVKNLINNGKGEFTVIQAI